MKHLIWAIILVLCTSTISAKTYLVDSNLSPTVSDELLAQHNNDGGTYALYNGKFYRIGVTGFRSLKEFADNQTTCGASAGDTLYVAPGVYTEGATINVAGLTILGHNANRDWTVTRDALESELQAVLYIEASDITVNGFKVTNAGRIISATATNSTPITNLRVIYNKFENSTVTRDWGNQVVYFGPRHAGATANSTSSQLRYLDCEVAHNHFYYPTGTTTTFPGGIDLCGVGGTTNVHDNYFNSGGTSVMIENSQGVVNIKNNVFKNVGKDTWSGADGGLKGDFAIYLSRCAFANSTTTNIQDNEFDGCTGQESLAALIRVYGGGIGSANFVTPVDYKININRNTFKGKTTIVDGEIMKSDNSGADQAGENLILYQDRVYTDEETPSPYDNTRYNIQDNHYDNRLYKYAWIRLDDNSATSNTVVTGFPYRREIYANNFSEFILGGKYSTFGNSKWATDEDPTTEISTNITDHAAYYSGTEINHYPNTVIQSFDIDMATGDIYFLQKLRDTDNSNLCADYGLTADEEEGLILSRVTCTRNPYDHRHTSNAYYRLYQYSTTYESMKILRAGHGVKLSVVRDKDGQLWMITGGKGDNNGTGQDRSGTCVAKFKFVDGARAILDGRTTAHSADIYRSDMSISYIEHPQGLKNVYGTADELSRYFCFSSSGGGRQYCIYDLDDILEGEANPRLIKRVDIASGATANEQKCAGEDSGENGEGLAAFKTADNGFETWSYQSYAIAGDYLYILEGVSDENSSTITSGNPTIVISTYNWRTGKYLKRTRIDYGRTNKEFGEPEGIVVRPDIYGHTALFLGLADGAGGARAASIYKFHINRYIVHDTSSENVSYLTYGDDTQTTSTHFNTSQYPAIEFSHAVTSDDANVTCNETDINFGTLSDATPRTAVVTITNAGEYRYGQWVGTVTGADGGQFNVDVSDNEQFQTSTVTATVTFTPDIKKREYNASLRFHSPLATSNEESNDIVINLTAAYDGPLTYGMTPRMATEQVTQTIDNEDYYSFNLAYNAMLPEPYDNAYLAYTNGEAADVLPFRELIDKYVVVMEDSTGNFESTDLMTDKASHITIGNENSHEGDDWTTSLSSKNVDNTYSKKGYGSVERDNFADQISITNGFEVSQVNASESKAEGASHFSSYADVFSKPLVFHNVDPNKSYKFRLYLSKSSAEKMDAWKALYLDYADGASNAMYIPTTAVAYNNTMVKAVDEIYTADTEASDMPMGSHNSITNEGTTLTDPIHYRGVNEISADGKFGTLHVTSEVVNFWDIDYDIDLGGDISASYTDNKMNDYKNSEGLLKGITTSLSYLPVEFATTKNTAEDGRTRNEPTEATQTYNTKLSVDYARSTDNSLPEILAEGVADESVIEFSNAPTFSGLTLSSDKIVAKLWEHDFGHLIYGSWDDGVDDYHKYYYDAFIQLNWDDDIDLNHGVGVYASGLQCTGHNNVNVAPTEILSDSWIDNYGYDATSVINKIGYLDYNGTYSDDNNWSEIAANNCSMPIKVHYVYGGNDKITSAESASVPITLTTDYPILVKSTPTLSIEGEAVATPALLSTDTSTEWIDMVTIPTNTTISITGNDIITGVEDLLIDNNDLSIYPNPAVNFVNVSSSSNLQYIEIFSIDGQLMICEQVDGENVKLDVSGLTPGTYILRVANQSTLLIKR